MVFRIADVWKAAVSSLVGDMTRQRERRARSQLESRGGQRGRWRQRGGPGPAATGARDDEHCKERGS